MVTLTYKKRHNKKGDAKDLFFFAIMILIIAIVTIVSYTLFIEVQDGLANSGLINNTDGSVQKNILGDGGRTFTMLDSVYLIFIAALFIGAIVTTFLLNTHPLAFFTFNFILILALIVSVPLSEVYDKLEDRSDFTNATESFGSITHISKNLPTWLFFIGVMMMVSLYAKFRLGGGFSVG
tara:strand:+ start:2132 stop:2671 length:540 start_codon:yes stop_codon:yes gene_type:complete